MFLLVLIVEFFVQPPGFNTHEIRHAFLRFFTSLFQMYRLYMVDRSPEGERFKSEEFLAGMNLSESSTFFVKEILATQMFHNFIVERCENPTDPEVLFFDDTINAKFNRSKKVVLTGRKKETTFLDDTRSMVRTFSKCYYIWIILQHMTSDDSILPKWENYRLQKPTRLLPQVTLVYLMMVARINIAHFQSWIPTCTARYEPQ